MFPDTSSPVEETTSEISATAETINITSTRKANEFFDPMWQLAITIELYIQYAVIAIGIVGVAANWLVLYALILHHARQTKKRAVNLLMINQNLLDFTACVLLLITFSLRVSNIYLTGALGYFLCVIFITENASNCTVFGSVLNLMALTVERYLKVVHPFWSRKYLKRWMIYAAVVFSWIGGILGFAPIVFVTTVIEDGICLGYFTWESVDAKIITYVWTFSIYFVVPVILLIFCYARIVVVMNRQMKVMAGHNVEAGHMSTSQLQSKRAKSNVIKTMIIFSLSRRFIVFLKNVCTGYAVHENKNVPLGTVICHIFRSLFHVL